MKRSAALFKQAQRHLVGGVDSPVRAFKSVGGAPVFFERAKGAVVTGADGERYVDFVGSWGPMIVGHAHPKVVRAAQRATAKGSSFGAPSALETELAARVKDAFPSIDLLRFTSSGTEAVMGALRAARAYTGRDKIVKFEGGYHGHADYLLVKAGSGAATLGSPDSAGVTRGAAKDTLTLPYNDLAAVERCFKKQGKKIAALILEPVAGNMGVIVPGKAYLQGLRRITRKYGALLVFDEVMTGWRACWGGAQTFFGVTPDLTTLGKVVGGGFPVGAYGGRKAIMSLVAPLGPAYQAGTLSGNPVAMAAGIATLDLLKARKPWKAMTAWVDALAEQTVREAQRLGLPVTVNTWGSMFTIFLKRGPVVDFKTATPVDPKAYPEFFHRLLKEGVYFAPSPYEACFVSAAHGKAELAKTGRAVRAALRALA